MLFPSRPYRSYLAICGWRVPPSEDRGISMWMGHGPWAARYFAAPLYVQDCRNLLSDWDWAAQFLGAHAPSLFDSSLVSAHKRSPAVSLPSTPEDGGKHPKLKVNLPEGVTRSDGDFSPLRRHTTRSRCFLPPRPPPKITGKSSRTRQEDVTTPPRGRQSGSRPRGGHRDSTPQPLRISPPRGRPATSPTARRHDWSRKWYP